MGQFDSIIQRTVEKLYEDERLRSHLTDDEAKTVLGWAEQWLTTQISSAHDSNAATQIAQNEFARVRQAVSAMNTLAAKPGALNLADAVSAINPLAAKPGALNPADAATAIPASMQAQGALPRETLFKLITQWIATLWRTR